MNISVENIDKVNAVMTAVVEPADYTEKYEKAIKDAKKKMNMPGFRPGMVPVGLIKKQFGVSILAEEVNKILQDGLFGYIRENKINMLGEPLPTEDNNKVELKEGESFTFKFDLAIAPEFEVSLTKKDKIDYYNVDVTDQMVENQVEMYRQRGGKYEQVDSYEDNDMIKGVITELDVETPVTAENVVMLPKYFKNDDQKKLFEGAKLGDIITWNPRKAYPESDVELSSLLKIQKEDVKDHEGDFTYQITEISRYVKAEIGQELFDQTFGEGNVKDEKEFRQKISDIISQQFKADSDYKFLLDVRAHMEKKVGKLEFPEALLKRVMLNNNKDKGEKFVEDNFEASIKELGWHLIKEQLVAAQEIKVEDDDLKQVAKEAARAQFAQYGMSNIPDEYLDNYAQEMLKKRENIDGLVDRAVDLKLTAALKGVVKLNEKDIALEDFQKMLQEK